MKDLRSISILPILSKIMEKSLDKQIRGHINAFQILPSKQSGFREGYSCATALTLVTDDILRSLDNNQILALILLDFSKAFNLLNHEILVAKLHHVGFKKSASDMILSFLLNRMQLSELMVSQGVPQGSILGPLLYSIYTCSFDASLEYCDYHVYTDDTQIYVF